MNSFVRKLIATAAVVTVFGARAGTAQGNPGIVHRIVKVAATNDEWTSTGIKLQAGDVVVLFAPGVVRVGAMLGEVDADGRRGNENVGVGVLHAKVGTGAGFPVGKRFVFQASEPGVLKLKVQDSRYEDNAGVHSVRVIRIPAESLPAAEEYVEP